MSSSITLHYDRHGAIKLTLEEFVCTRRKHDDRTTTICTDSSSAKGPAQLNLGLPTVNESPHQIAELLAGLNTISILLPTSNGEEFLVPVSRLVIEGQEDLGIEQVGIRFRIEGLETEEPLCAPVDDCTVRTHFGWVFLEDAYGEGILSESLANALIRIFDPATSAPVAQVREVTF